MKQYALQLRKGLLRPNAFMLDKETTLGRGPHNVVDFTDPFVSRKHAELTRRNGQWGSATVGVKTAPSSTAAKSRTSP
jgi:pSer/pThr/pTyr-binding forkhead associated (FHA) protein